PTTRRIGRKIARNLAGDRHPRRLRARGKAYESDARTRAELMGSPWHRTILDQPWLLACTGCEAAFNPILTKYEHEKATARPTTAGSSLVEEVRVEGSWRQRILPAMKRRTFLGAISAGAAGVLTGGLQKLLAAIPEASGSTHLRLATAGQASSSGETFLLGGDLLVKRL